MRFVNWLFAKEEINGERCPTYMYRWRLLGLYSFFKVYLHHFVGNDWTKDLHDHPKRFISIGLRGSYIEETPGGERAYIAPWLRTFSATHIHRLRATDCWTLVIVGKPTREWGFWSNGQWVQWLQYIKSSLGDKRRDC